MAYDSMDCDFLVVGGGIAGICAAIQAGRLGLNSILVEKEWSLGGNGGPLLGVRWGGVNRPGWSETGIVEELTLRLNARHAFIDGVAFNTHPMMEEIFEEVLCEAGVKVLRRHLPLSAETVLDNDGHMRVSQVRILNIENLEQFDIAVNGFVLDSSGDAALAALADAETVMGRESKVQTGERSAPEKFDAVVAASSVTAMVVDTGIERPFVPPPGTPKWNPDKPACVFDPSRKVNILFQVDAGGDARLHPLRAPQELYQQLRLHIYSMWDHMKNGQFPEKAKTHELIWISPLLGRRESRRVVGDYMLTQADLESGKNFPDDVAFAGCSLDFHPPSYDGGYECIFYSSALLHGIPLRSLYSRNVENLFCAGRNISATHLAQGGIRLIRTCGIMGQATAVAARRCKDIGKTPRELTADEIGSIQQLLLRNDALILGPVNDDSSDIARTAAIEASSEASLSTQPHKQPVWLDANRGVGVALHCYPDEIKTARMFVRNLGGETVVRFSAGYLESTAPQWPDVHERLPGEKYVFRPPHAPTEITTDMEWPLTLQAGFAGWLTVVPEKPWSLKPYSRAHFSQAAWLAIEGPIEVAAAKRQLEIVQPIKRDGGSWAICSGAAPALEVTPDPMPGRAAQIIDGHIQSEGLARTHQWISQDALPQWLCLNWTHPRRIRRIVLRFDTTCRHASHFISPEQFAGNCVADYRLEVLTEQGWRTIVNEKDNHLRVREHALGAAVETKSLRLVVERMRDQREPARVHEISIGEDINDGA